MEVPQLRVPELFALVTAESRISAHFQCQVPVFSSNAGYVAQDGKALARKVVTAASGLEAVFMANRPALLRYVRARLRNEGESEDILQDLWLKLSNLETGPISEPLAYLYRMAENQVLDRRRSAMRRTNRETQWTKGQIDGTVDSSVDSQPSAERTLIARDFLKRVNEALDALPDRTAYAFRAVRIEGTPQKDIAAAMGVSLSAVEKHLQNAYRAVVDLKLNLDAEQAWPERLDTEGPDHVG